MLALQRLTQGLPLLVAECSKYQTIGFACSLVPVSSLIGTCIAAALGAVVTLDNMPMWAWRVPFLFSLIIGVLVFTLRHHLAKAHVFKESSSHQKANRYKIINILKRHKKNFLCVVGVSTYYTASFYIFMTYVMGFSATDQKLLSTHQSMLINTGIMLALMVLFPLMGIISDKIGIKRLLQYGSMGTVLVSLPLFWFMHQDITITRIAFVMCVFAVLHAASVGPSGAFLAYLFPTEEKYTGIGFGSALGAAIAGAITPVIIIFLMHLTNNGTASALYLMICAFIGWLSVHKAELIAQDLPQDFSRELADDYTVELLATKKA